MKWQLWLLAATFAISIVCLDVDRAAAQYGTEVVSYAQGSTPVTGATNSSVALGEPERFTGEGVFPGVVSPFSPPFLNTEIVSVGEGGWLTLRLSNFAIPQAGSPEIGVFTNAGWIDTNFPNGVAGPALDATTGTFGIDRAEVEVSEDGLTWESLGLTTFDIPTSGYTDLGPFSGTPGSNPTDFQQPFAGSLSDFQSLSYPDILNELAGSGGGTWLDISSTSFSQVGYLRFSVADDGDAGTELNFELDAVSIATGAVGVATVPEPSTFVLALAGLFGIAGSLATRRRLSRVHCDV